MTAPFTSKSIGSLREEFGLSQNELAIAIQITQSQVSRLEASGKPLTPSQAANFEAFLEKNVPELLSEQPFASAQAKLSKAAAVAGQIQDLTGNAAVIAIGLFPQRIQRAILTGLTKRFDILGTKDPELDSKQEQALAIGKIGQMAVKCSERIKIAAHEERWEDVSLLAPSTLEEIARSSDDVKFALAPLCIKIKHQWALAIEIFDKDYALARQMLEEILHDPAADARDKSIALYEKAFSFIEEYKLTTKMSAEMRINLSHAEAWLLEANRLEPSNPWTGYGVVHLADLILALGEAQWASSLMDEARTMFERVDITPLIKLIGSLGEARNRWPNLSKKHNTIKNTMKWLSAIVIACSFTAGTAHAHQTNTTAYSVSERTTFKPEIKQPINNKWINVW